MNNKRKKLLISVIILGISLVILLTYLIGLIHFSSHFLPNTFINGVNVSNMDLQKANEALSSIDPTLTIIQKDITGTKGIGQDLNLRKISKDISLDSSQALKKQNAALWFLLLGDKSTAAYKVSGTLNEDKANELINELYCLQSENIRMPLNAHYEIKDGGLKLVLADRGSYIREDIARSKVSDLIHNIFDGTDSDVLDLQEYYTMPEIASNDPKLNEQKTYLEKIINSGLSIFINDDTSVSVDPDTLGELIIYDGNDYVVDEDKLNTYVNELAIEHNISANEYIDKNQLKNDLKEAILKGSGEQIKINWIEEVHKEIRVSIPEQTLRYYENDALVLTSPIVSGNGDITDATPTGHFEVTKKTPNSTLSGAGYVEHVDYWIGFDPTGRVYGFHDASWRSEFGGDIYLSDPSRGCVNMPTDKIAQLYRMVDIGTDVYISN